MLPRLYDSWTQICGYESIEYLYYECYELNSHHSVRWNGVMICQLLG